MSNGGLKGFFKAFAAAETPLWATILVALIPIGVSLYQDGNKAVEDRAHAAVQTLELQSRDLHVLVEAFTLKVMHEDRADATQREAVIRNIVTQHTTLDQIKAGVESDRRPVIEKYQSQLVALKEAARRTEHFSDLQPFYQSVANYMPARDAFLLYLKEKAGEVLPTKG